MSFLWGMFIFMPHMAFWGLGGLLLILELLATTGYALWSGISAVIIGLLVWIYPALSMSVLWLLFSIFTLLSAYSWWLWIQKYNRSQGYRLNDPHRDFIGLRTIVTTEIVNGFGRIKVRDSTWIAASSSDLPLGTNVTIVDMNGVIMIVKREEV